MCTVLDFPLIFLPSTLWSHSCPSTGVGKLDGLQELLSTQVLPLSETFLSGTNWFILRPQICPFAEKIRNYTSLQNAIRLDKQIIFLYGNQPRWFKQAGMQLQGEKKLLCIHNRVQSSNLSIKEHFLYSAYLQTCLRSYCLVGASRLCLGNEFCGTSCICIYKR